MPFRQAIHSTAAQLSVVALNFFGFLRIDLIPLVQRAVAEIRRQIHDPYPPGDQLWGHATGQTVGKAQNREVRDLGDAVGIGGFHQRIIRKR